MSGKSRVLFCILLAVSLSSTPAFCSAEEMYRISSGEMDRLERNLNELNSINERQSRESKTLQTQLVQSQTQQYLSEKRALENTCCGSYEQNEALARLLKYTARGSMLTEYEESLFAEHVDHIVVYERTEIGFAMKCGPVFRERL